MTTPPGGPEGPGDPQEPQQPQQPPQEPQQPPQQPPPPAPPQQPYQQPGQPQYQPPTRYPQQPAPVYQSPPNAPGAVPALILGIVGLVLCGIAAPFAWWQGQSAERAIEASGGTLGGKGMATTGKILGIVGTAILALGLVALIVVVIVGAANS